MEVNLTKPTSLSLSATSPLKGRTNLKIATAIFTFLRVLNKALALPLLVAIYLYQRTLSPDHGIPKVFYPYGFCKFHPTCSMFAKEVIKRDGLMGLPKAVKRILSCNPASLGGIDLP